jgi:hypothetical protein
MGMTFPDWLQHWTEQAFTDSVSVVKKIQLGTAVDSDIAVIVAVSGTCIIAFIFTRAWPLLLIASAPILMYFQHYGYWQKNKPEYLRREKHVENMARIQLGAMGDSKKSLTEEAIETLDPTKNPETLKIEAGETAKTADSTKAKKS